MSRRKLSAADRKSLNRKVLSVRYPPGGGPAQVGPIRNAPPPRPRKRKET